MCKYFDPNLFILAEHNFLECQYTKIIIINKFYHKLQYLQRKWLSSKAYSKNKKEGYKVFTVPWEQMLFTGDRLETTKQN